MSPYPCVRYHQPAYDGVSSLSTAQEFCRHHRHPLSLVPAPAVPCVRYHQPAYDGVSSLSTGVSLPRLATAVPVPGCSISCMNVCPLRVCRQEYRCGGPPCRSGAALDSCSGYIWRDDAETAALRLPSWPGSQEMLKSFWGCCDDAASNSDCSGEWGRETQ